MRRVADFTAPAANLLEAWQQLELAWDNLKDVWSDSTREAFEANYISHIRPRVKMTLDALGRLSTVADEAQRKCELPRQNY